MDDQFLLCDEVWDSMNSPVVSDHFNDSSLVHSMTKQDCENSFRKCLRHETKFMSGSPYVHFLHSNSFVSNCRFKSIRWLIHSQRRFNLHIGTVFKAVNYVDRFIYINQCHGWNYWMMELLALASLSIATKFDESCPPSLHEIQEGLEYCFEANLVKRMELAILKSLRWELNSITAHSYVELVVWELNSILKPSVLNELSSRLNNLLLASSLDDKMLVYRPCVIVMSGLRCVLEDLIPKTHKDCLSHITSFVPPDQSENLPTCCKLMQDLLVRYCKSEADANPSSPETVLSKGQIAINEDQIDLSFLDGNNVKNNKLKRKRKKMMNVLLSDKKMCK